jgi:hypothetical protein
VKVAAWSIDGGEPTRVAPSSIQLERQLEDWIERDPDLVAEGLEIVGRQVSVEAGRLDLLAVDPGGQYVVIELKSGALYIDAITQALYYAACVATMPEASLERIASDYRLRRGKPETPQAPSVRAPSDAPSLEEREVSIIVVGTGRDAGLDRLLPFLAGRYQVPIRSVTFDVFVLSNGQQLLLREVTESPPEATVTKSRYTVEAVMEIARENGVDAMMNRYLDMAKRHGIYPRPWPLCIQFSPPTNRTRYLFTVWPGRGGLWISHEALGEFYPFSVQDMARLLPSQGWHDLTDDLTTQIVGGLDELFAIAEGTDADNSSAQLPEH